MNAKAKLIGLLDYVQELARLPERAVLTVRSYRTLLFYEHHLRGRVGIYHDVADVDGTIWLRIDRLQRKPPPTPDDNIRSWLTVSRDPTKRPEVRDSIIRSMSKDEAEELLRASRVDADDVMASPKGGTTTVDVRLRLDRFPELMSSIRVYCDGPWSHWSSAEMPRRETIAIYEKFFTVLQAIETAGVENPLEVVFGVGFALWKTEGKTIEHPIIEALVEANIDPGTHAIHVRARDTEPQVYLKPFEELGVPAVPSLRKEAQKHFEGLCRGTPDTDAHSLEGFSPFIPGSFEPVLREAVRSLSPGAAYWPDSADDLDDRTMPDITDVLRVTDNWAIYVRPRSANFFAQDIQRLKEAIEKSDEDKLPLPARRLVTPPGEVGEQHAAPSQSGGFGTGGRRCAGESGDAQVADNADPFFPKPFNDAQVKIIRRLARQEGVVVQGPPGTGKTHTIANIICHYLATGRSVLVVSKGEPALEVLREQLPDEVRNLAISLLTSEREGLKQLEAAIMFMANHVVTQDETRLIRSCIEKENELQALREEIKQLEQEIESWAKKHLEKVPELLRVDSKDWPADLARIVSEQKGRHQWLTDDIGPSSEYEPQFTQRHLDDLRSARCRLGVDLVYCGATLPNRNDLPDVHAVSAVHVDLLRAASLAEGAARKRLPSTTIWNSEAICRAQRLQGDLGNVRGFLLEAERHRWLWTLYATWIKSGLDAEETRMLREVISDIDRLADTRKQFIQRPVVLPSVTTVDVSVVAAVRRASRGMRPFPMLTFGNQPTKQNFESIEVCGKRPEGVEQWKHVANYFEYCDKLRSLVSRWDAVAPEFDLPPAPRDAVAADRWLGEIQRLLKLADRAVDCYRDHIAGDLDTLFYHDVDRSQIPFDAAAISRMLDAIETELSRLKLAASRGSVDVTLERLRNCSGRISDDLCTFLTDSVGDSSWDTESVAGKWRELLAEVQRLNNLKSDLEAVREVTAIIEKSGAPRWAEALRTRAVDGDCDPHIPSDALDTWRFRRLESYLRSIDARSSLSKLAKRRSECIRRLDRVMAKVVQHRTYIALKERMQGPRLAALMQFLAAIMKIGAGTGVAAPWYRRAARDALRNCMDAVPCWIMPTWRVSESLPATLGAFDLLIVDEASQSDVTALPTLFRAKKVLVVGDDRQVSPTPVGLAFRTLLQLQHSYLQGQPFADMVMPGTSLYALAGVLFSGERIFLNEHFRCVEPIIQFSLKFYSEKIFPLRIPAPSERLDPPLIDVYVSNGSRDGNKVNRAEACAIVNQIERLVRDPAYANRSIGVISLLGHKQAHVIQKDLIERIGEEAFLRHRIACGDSATFQGKERDVMFLSMVASPGKAHAQVARLFEQRFNVALSRARDRMYLFRSVGVEDLQKNSQDLKLRVINHFRTPMPTGRVQLEELGSLCESDFERDVFSRLLRMEYRVTPQMSVGDYRIDLVVDGHNDRRLAVELDGDRFHGPERWGDDYRRQKDLERVGWRFWRCWASSFYLDPDGCMFELVSVLREMKIEPIGQTQETRVFTEHIIVNTDEHVQAGADNGADDETGEKTEIGDKVIVAFEAEPDRYYLLTLTENEEDLENGIIGASTQTGKALLGASAEDEVELLWRNGESRNAVIVEIQKANGGADAALLQGVPEPRDVFYENTASAGQTDQGEVSNHKRRSGTPPNNVVQEVAREKSRREKRPPPQGRPSRVDTASGQRSLFSMGDATDDGDASDEERQRYKEYSERMKAAGMPARPMPEWLEEVRRASRRTQG